MNELIAAARAHADQLEKLADADADEYGQALTRGEAARLRQIANDAVVEEQAR